jgi:twitching motility protein PilT
VDINDYLRDLVKRDGSDLHLRAGGPAYVRVDGDLVRCEGLPELTPADTTAFATQGVDIRAVKRGPMAMGGVRL